jgi:ring-1,2-phenylacetyl-CoA epoxidase subunit PaaD
MVTEADILEVLRTIPDPEMPISIVDLGIVHHVGIAGIGPAVPDIRVEILPTFVGCPALRVIEEQVVAKVSQLPGVGVVRVDVVYDPPWSVDRISSEGRAALSELGVTVPQKAGGLVALNVKTGLDSSKAACPFCGSDRTELESAFGPTRCKMIYYCPACGNSFEHLKDLR